VVGGCAVGTRPSSSRTALFFIAAMWSVSAIGRRQKTQTGADTFTTRWSRRCHTTMLTPMAATTTITRTTIGSIPASSAACRGR
jgi:hypothetical protein